MSTEALRGTISFVNYEKLFATIDYTTSTGKAKSVNAKIAEGDKDNKKHHFRVGDIVDFELKLSDRGDKMTAVKLKFLYNTAVEQLINKAAVENRFSGYLKLVDDKMFVKEWNNYLFFPLQLSPWEKPPAETAENEAISFRLLNLDKPHKLTAELFSHQYIPEYKMALKHFEEKKPVTGKVYKVSPHAVYISLFDKINAKLDKKEGEEIKEGDKVEVIISYLGSNKIVIKKT